MHNVVDFSQPVPEDWNDEHKYPNKKLDYISSEKDYMFMKRPFNYIDGKLIEDNSKEPYPVYFGFIHELWVYDNPSNNITGKGAMIFVKCPKCGSYNIKKSYYDDLCPEALAGSAGIEYECKDCGHFHREAQIMS